MSLCLSTFILLYIYIFSNNFELRIRNLREINSTSLRYSSQSTNDLISCFIYIMVVSNSSYNKSISSLYFAHTIQYV